MKKWWPPSLPTHLILHVVLMNLLRPVIHPLNNPFAAFFWGRHQRQNSLLTTGVGDVSDLFSDSVLNPILDSGCPAIIIGLPTAVRISHTFVQSFQFRSISGAPFIHGYGSSCTNSSLAFAIWYVSIHDILERPLNLSFFVTLGNCHSLIGRGNLTPCTLHGPGNSLSFPFPGDPPFILPTYDDPPTFSSSHTYLSVVPNHSSAVTSTIQTVFALRSSYFSERLHIPKIAFAFPH